MKRILSGVVLASFALFGLAGTARAQDAAALYASRCAGCHGKDGKGETAMGKKMNAPDLSKSGSEADVEKTIADGKGKMPGYKGKISDAEIASLAKYVKSTFK